MARGVDGLFANSHALGHAVVQQGGNGLQFIDAKRLLFEQAFDAAFDLHTVFDGAFHALHRQAAVARNVGGLRRPRRNRAQARHDHDELPRCVCLRRFAISEQSLHLVQLGLRQIALGCDPMRISCRHPADPFVDSLQLRQQTLRARRTQGIAAREIVVLGCRHGAENQERIRGEIAVLRKLRILKPYP